MTTTSTIEHTLPEGLDRAGEILTDEALQFVAELHRRFAPRRAEVGREPFEAYFAPAARLIADLVLDEEYVDFLTLPAYELIEGR